MAFDAAIVGAGIVGAACAATLAREGLSVVVIDKDGPATGTTAAGMGHIVVMDDSEAQFALTHYSQRLWNEISAEMPAACEYDRCGTIWIAADEDEMGEVRRKHEYYLIRGIGTEILDAKQLRTAEPNLAHGLAGGLLVEGDAVVYQMAATKFLMERAARKGAVLRIGSRAVRITDERVELEHGDHIAADIVINAAGVAAEELTPQLKIERRKGHLVITERYSNFARHQLVELGYLKSAHGRDSDSVAFNVQPRLTGQVLLGSSRQFGSNSTNVDYAILQKMTARAFEYMPRLRDLVASRIWTGFRPATPDNLPYIGRIPDFDKVYAAAGHEGLGITTALGTAELIADEIVGRNAAIPVEAYRPGR